MPNPENPQFIKRPGPEERDYASLVFRDMEEGVEYDVDEDPFHHRIVLRTPSPEYALVGVVFLKDSKRTHQKPDLRDLVIEHAAQDDRRTFLQEKAFEAVRAGGFEPVAIPPRYPKKPEVGPTEEEKYQDNIPGNEDPFKRFFSKRRR